MSFDADSNRVVLESEGIPVLYAESYEIALGMLQQPASFALRMGSKSPLREHQELWPPNTPFSLSIGGAVQFTGRSDGFTSSTGSGSTLTVRGRDALAPLHDAFATSERSFSDATFEQLVNAALTEVHGLSAAPTLIYTNEANRKAITGAPVRQTKPPAVEGVDPAVLAAQPAAGKKLQIKMGQRWLSDFLKPELDRAGLFLWAAGDGTLILSTPNTSLEPTYRISRKFVGSVDKVASNVLASDYKNEPTARYSRCDVHCRSAGDTKARVTSFGTYVDEEMVALGYNRPLCIKDDRAKTIQQAEFLARRKIAEARRAGWSLTYTIAGHTLPCLATGAPAVVSPDTVIEVDDDVHGLTDRFWVESVVHARNPQTTTRMVLMRLSDVIFGSDPDA